MRVAMATSAATADKPNEDFVGAVPNAVVLLDGAGIVGTESICRHGVAWYTHRLGGALLGQLSRADGQELPSVLGAAIEQVTDSHRETCDTTNPSSPQATVAIVRLDGDRADYLVLADSFLVLDLVKGGPLVITDPREVTIRNHYVAALADFVQGTPEYDRALDRCREQLRARRNRPDGYWIAKDDPRAAFEAVTGSQPLGDITSAALLSNGASRIVDRFGLADWPETLALLGTDGPSEVIRRVREAEATDPDSADDATVAHCVRLRERP